MKFTALSILLLFVTFLITPTIVSVLEKDADISIFYNFSEEEHAHKVFKEFCAIQTSNDLFYSQPYRTSLIISENLSKHDKICCNIFLPPPNVA